MSRYVDALVTGMTISKTFGISLIEFEKAFSEIPIADVEKARHGYWIHTYSQDYNHFKCSNCGFEEISKIHYDDLKASNYCPNCGARMDGGGEE